MNLNSLKDKELLSKIKRLVKNEREILTQVLQHLREVEKRKLFSDLGYQSLFAYAVQELKYSEGQAGRRIQAMRLMKEIPAIEDKIKTGRLSLSNISQAQSYFRETKKTHAKLQQKNSEVIGHENNVKLETRDKLQILESLENKSAREGQKVLIQLNPTMALPKERERLLTENHTEVSFVMSEALKNKIQALRSLMGVKGADMSLAELVEHMVGVSIDYAKAKKFGKKRAQNKKELKRPIKTTPNTPTPESQTSKNARYISKAIQYQVWRRDQSQCTGCKSQRNLNIDHIIPVALGGPSQLDNLRLLCFHCNQRQAMKVFGVNAVQKRKPLDMVSNSLPVQKKCDCGALSCRK